MLSIAGRQWRKELQTHRSGTGFKVQSIIPLKFKNNCTISQSNKQQHTNILTANEMPHIKYIKKTFILTRAENSSIIFSVKVQGSCFSVFLTVVLHYRVINNKIFQTEVFQNQIKAVQLPLHLISTEYLNTLFAFEPRIFPCFTANSLASISLLE